MPVLYRAISAFSRLLAFRRSKKWQCHHSARNSLCAMLALGFFSAAGESASEETLASQADAVLVAEVSFLPYGHLVLIREILHGDKNSLPDPIQFLGVCLPRKAGVRQLAEQSQGPAVQIYREAIERATYTAVLFLKREAGSLNPLCNESASIPEHSENHPNHAAWRAKVVTSLRTRR